MPTSLMDVMYSKVISVSEYETHGLSDGIDLRKYRAADLQEVGTFRAQDDWRRLVGLVKSPYKGGLGPRISFMAVTVPECRPERLEIVSYANKFAFLHDSTLHIATGKAERSNQFYSSNSRYHRGGQQRCPRCLE